MTATAKHAPATYVRDKDGHLVREVPPPKPSRVKRALKAGFRFAGRCLPWGRYRALVAPYWLSLVAAVLATAAQVHGQVLVPLLVGFGLAALFWWGPSLLARRRARSGDDVDDEDQRAGTWLDRTPERAYAVAVVATAGLMTALVAGSGWTAYTGWTWVVLTAGGALPWQNHYRWWLRGPSSAGELHLVWDECRAKIPALKDVELGPNIGEDDVEKRLLTVPAGKEASAVLGVGNAVAGICDMPIGSVTVTLGDDDEELSARCAWIVKAPRQKLRESQIFQGPSLARAGTMHLANAADGRLEVVAHDKDGVKHFGGFGTTGSGKGGVLAVHLVNRLETGWWLPVYLDGKSGTSIHPALQDACYHVARRREEWILGILAVHRAMEQRKEEFAARGWTRYRIWEMWREYPAVALIGDEAPTLARNLPPPVIRKWLEITEQGRALGFATGMFGQSSRGDMVPGGTPMRGLLTAGGSVWYGRAGDSPRDKKVAIYGREYRLNQFPPGAGWAYVVDGAAPGQRVAKARSLYIPDDPGDVDHLTGWTPSKPLPEVPEKMRLALGFDVEGVDLTVTPEVLLDTEPTAKDAILAVLAAARDGNEGELSMGEITRRTAQMPWRDGRAYDRSTVREQLPQMVDKVMQGDNGWRLVP